MMPSSKQNKDTSTRASGIEYSDSRLAEVIHVLGIEANITKLPIPAVGIWDILGILPVFALSFAIFYLLMHLHFLLSILGAIGMSAFFFSLAINVKRHTSRLAERLPRSGIVEMLAIGPPWLEKIYDYTPWPWSLIYLGARPCRLRDWIRLLSRNLDWYLDEPKTFFRPVWVGYPLGFLVYFIFGWINIESPDSVPSNFALAFVVLLPTLILGAISKQKQHLSAALLRDYLRERLAEDENEAES